MSMNDCGWNEKKLPKKSQVKKTKLCSGGVMMLVGEEKSL
jgi:hypothetical protein